jgi:hypothetical protein
MALWIYWDDHVQIFLPYFNAVTYIDFNGSHIAFLTIYTVLDLYMYIYYWILFSYKFF